MGTHPIFSYMGCVPISLRRRTKKPFGGSKLSGNSSVPERKGNPMRNMGLPPERIYIDISFEGLEEMLGEKSQLTDIQKAVAWKEVQDKYVTWIGEIVDVYYVWYHGSNEIKVKQSPQTATYDVVIDVSDEEERKKLFSLIKGQRIRYSGSLQTTGAIVSKFMASLRGTGDAKYYLDYGRINI